MTAPGPEQERERLIIPNSEELLIAWHGMRARVSRALTRGDNQITCYENASRILKENPHLQTHLSSLATSAEAVLVEEDHPLQAAYFAGVKDLLELLSTSTTNYEVNQLDMGIDSGDGSS